MIQDHDPLRAVRLWLFLCAAMVLAMAIIGAITRLTESGLSITEWKPITGALPPMNHAEWVRVFDQYQQTPEYRAKNLGMSLNEFKVIYFWEWFHRLWGRLIGVVFAVPFFIFWIRGVLSPRLTAALLGVLVLGGTQGFIGWFMVESGLVDRPSVSHYRLALHLSCAALVYMALIALALKCRQGQAQATQNASVLLKAHALLAMLSVFITLVWGAFVAGLDAGLIYNEFPTMGEGRLLPVELWHLTPWWINLFENHAGVQWMHRVLAMVTMVVILGLVGHAWAFGRRNRLYIALAGMVCLQVGLGIATLLSNVHLHTAVTHQAGAFILLGLMVFVLADLFRRPTPRSH